MTAQVLSELMDQHDAKRAAWIEAHGNDDGFREWFTDQVLPPLQVGQLVKFNEIKNARGYPGTGEILTRHVEAGTYDVKAWGLGGPGTETTVNDVPRSVLSPA